MAQRFRQPLLPHESGESLRVAICTPCQDQVSAGYAHDLARLTGSNAATDLVLLRSQGTIIPQQRHSLVKKALEANATHLLWLDSDMRFPPDSLGRLMSHGAPIVGANYPTRRNPILPTAEHRELGLLFDSPDSDGLQEVSHCGMGLMLVEAEVFRTLSEPWFILGFNPKESSYLGEDVFFCKKARDSGYEILIDQGLSKEVRHVGEMEYRHEHTLQTRDLIGAR